jgi:hypothetical protein
MYNSKHNTVSAMKLATRDIDPSTNLEYQRLVGELASGEPDAKRRGIIGINDAQNMWDSNKEHWASGNYPSTSDIAPGLAAVPHKGFADSLAGLPATVKRSEVDSDHPAITGERVIFGGIKNYDSGRHFDVHMFYEPDGPDSFRLKASTHIPGRPRTTIDGDGVEIKDHNSTNVHDDRVFDVASGSWHPRGESHESPNASSSYDPVDLVRSAPEDFADTTTQWKDPNPSLGFCKSCHRFPKFLDKMLDLMRPTKCTNCGTEGIKPEYAWQPGMFPEGRETSAMRQPVSTICGNRKCNNYKKSIAEQPAFVDSEFNVLYPGQEGALEKRIYQFTPETHKLAKEELLARKTTTKDKLREEWKAARKLGDFSENEEYKAATKALQDNERRSGELEHQLREGNHEIVASLPEGYENTTTAPFRTIYENPEFAAQHAGNDYTQIPLPMRSLQCDHKDCSCYGETISTHADITPDTDLTCSHCGRGESDGVSVVQTEDGYTRCNPVEYGANNCAPLPKRIKNAAAWLGWKKPNPDFKFPTVKADPETGVGILMQPDEESQDRNNAAGNYPGMQQIRTRNPMVQSRLISEDSPTAAGHGIESQKNFFNFGVTRPWAWLGMEGRNIAKRGSSKAENKLTLGDETITPNRYKSLADTPILGDSTESDLNVDDFLPEVGVSIADKYPTENRSKLATDAQGNVIHPELTEEDWNEYLGHNPKKLLGVKDTIRSILGGMRNSRKFYPIDLEGNGNQRISSKLASGDEDWDTENAGFDNPEAFLPPAAYTEENDYDEDKPYGSSPQALESLDTRIKNSLITDPEVEGIDSQDKAALEFAKDDAARQRQEDIEDGYVLKLSPSEEKAERLEKVGPLVVLNQDNDIDPETRAGLIQDVQEMAKEKPSFAGQNAAWDSPIELGRQQAILENTPDSDQDGIESFGDPELETVVHKNEPIKIGKKHDENCKKCDHRGIIIPSMVGPEKIKELNGIIGEGTAIIKRTEKDSGRQRGLISKLQADTYTCRG